MEESEQSDTFTFIFVNQIVTLKMLTNVFFFICVKYPWNDLTF